MKKIYLVFLLVLFSISVNAQSLLKLDKAQIKNYMASRHAILKNDYSYSISITGKPFIGLDYDFPDSLRLKDGIFNMKFSFTKSGKCYEYWTLYTNDKFLPKIIEQLSSTKSGLKRLGKDSIWTNLAKGYEVEISRGRFNNINYQKKYSIFSVWIHLRDSEFQSLNSN